MKKYFFMAVAALATLTACQPGDEPQTIVQTREIQFATAELTRATEVVDVTAETLKTSGFAVWGYMGSSSIFDATVVAHNSTNNTLTNLGHTETADAFSPASAADVKYWSAGQTYMFTAMAPSSLKEKYTYDASFNQKITGFENTDGQVDLVVSQPAQVILASNATQNAAVGLHFNHMLSRVRFSFTNTFDDNDVKIEIRNIKIENTPTSGDATIVYDLDAKTNTVSWTTTGTNELNFFDTKDELLLNVPSLSNNVGTSVYRYVIPGENNYTIAFDLVAKANEQIIAQKTYTGVTLPTDKQSTFAPGVSYIFNANIAADKVGNIYPIEWTVTVQDWGKDQDGGDISLN